MMSSFFTCFPISGLGEPKLYQNMVCFTMCGGIYDIVVIIDFVVFLEGYYFRGFIVLSILPSSYLYVMFPFLSYPVPFHNPPSFHSPSYFSPLG